MDFCKPWFFFPSVFFLAAIAYAFLCLLVNFGGVWCCFSAADDLAAAAVFWLLALMKHSTHIYVRKIIWLNSSNLQVDKQVPEHPVSHKWIFQGPKALLGLKNVLYLVFTEN